MRILAFTTEAFDGIGGIAQYTRDFLVALCAIPTCETVSVLPRRTAIAKRALPSNLNYIDSTNKNKWSYILAAWRASSTAKDIVICSHINLLPVAALAAWRCSAPLVLLVYGIDVWLPRNNPIVNFLLKRVVQIISISEFTRDKLAGWSGVEANKIYILPNAINLDEYGTGPRSPELVKRYGLEGRRVLMTLGRLSAQERYKGVDEMLELLPELLDTYPELVYLVVGDGDDRRRLQLKASSLGLSNNVFFTGYIDESEKVDHYRLADVFVMPGRGEGFGFVFLEAMACGIPVVASALDGSREAVRNGELGVVVNPDNKAEAKEGIIQALGRSKSIPAGLEYFSYPNFEQRVRTMVEHVISGARARK